MAKNREPQQFEDSDDQLSSDSGSGSEFESESEQQTPPPKSSTQIPNPSNSSDSDESLSGSDSVSDSDESEPESEPVVQKPDPSPKTGLTQKSKSNVGASDVKGFVVGVKRGAEKGVDSQDGKKPKKIENLGKKDGKYEGGSKKIGNIVKKDGKSEGGLKKDVVLEKSDGKSEGGLKKNEALVKSDGKSEGSSGSVLAGNDDVSKKLFQRVFSEDDEIVLLKGMLDFTAKEKSDPVAAIDEFLDFIKKLLHFDVTKAQLLNKIKRLKGKYVNNASKVKDGHERKFSKQHEREGYELSKRIWGTVDMEYNNVDGGMENGKVNGSVIKKCANTNVEEKALVTVKQVNGDGKLKGVSIGSTGLPDDVVSLYTYSALEQRIMSEEIKNIDRQKQRDLEKKLSKIEVAELQLCAMRWEYMAEKARLIIASKATEL